MLFMEYIVEMGPSSLKFIFAFDIYNAGNYHPVACRIYRDVCIVILNINFCVLTCSFQGVIY